MARKKEAPRPLHPDPAADIALRVALAIVAPELAEAVGLESPAMQAARKFLGPEIRARVALRLLSPADRLDLVVKLADDLEAGHEWG